MDTIGHRGIPYEGRGSARRIKDFDGQPTAFARARWRRDERWSISDPEIAAAQLCASGDPVMRRWRSCDDEHARNAHGGRLGKPRLEGD
jgi:hypothetical protein